ncbi:hypothetical protein [Gracilibacillus massiliensis]|uniref:hypothetical protein n=1 Tax=Gracilibacillus massiliensis TaxID=1564956 RepID=UPI00071D7A59|nr:hypothetical protein [Gracilibacillus massiliensis]
MEQKELEITIKEMLNNLLQRFNVTIEHFNKMEFEKGNEKLQFIFEDLNVLLEGVSIIEENYTEIEIEEINEKLELILNEMENKNYSLVSNIIEYELYPLLQHWEEHIIHA